MNSTNRATIRRWMHWTLIKGPRIWIPPIRTSRLASSCCRAAVAPMELRTLLCRSRLTCTFNPFKLQAQLPNGAVARSIRLLKALGLMARELARGCQLHPSTLPPSRQTPLTAVVSSSAAKSHHLLASPAPTRINRCAHSLSPTEVPPRDVRQHPLAPVLIQVTYLRHNLKDRKAASGGWATVAGAPPDPVRPVVLLVQQTGLRPMVWPLIGRQTALVLKVGLKRTIACHPRSQLIRSINLNPFTLTTKMHRLTVVRRTVRHLRPLLRVLPNASRNLHRQSGQNVCGSGKRKRRSRSRLMTRIVLGWKTRAIGARRHHLARPSVAILERLGVLKSSIALRSRGAPKNRDMPMIRTTRLRLRITPIITLVYRRNSLRCRPPKMRRQTLCRRSHLLHRSQRMIVLPQRPALRPVLPLPLLSPSAQRGRWMSMKTMMTAERTTRRLVF